MIEQEHTLYDTANFDAVTESLILKFAQQVAAHSAR